MQTVNPGFIVSLIIATLCSLQAARIVEDMHVTLLQDDVTLHAALTVRVVLDITALDRGNVFQIM
jgi:hypothetical protein